ncbi:uncharacterized protein LOC111057578 isoform X2 [Nilaparvata lugens]|uniref:uncharacterized protein LOC111057578 isoform X2 n=1 Tax=Nilaparvata lugens TaxID=108931 RepID=UPI00193D1109|nr:uncharacterized protein LOC111057578 isoform X2 [Nilaparvata lugens]
MMAFTQENIVSSTQGNAENYLGTSRESFDSLGAAGVQLCSVNCAKVSPLPSMKPQIAKFNVKEKLDQKKVQKNKSKNAKKKEKNKKKQKQNQLDKCFEGDEAFKETVNTLEMITGHIKDLILKRRRLLTVGRISGILNSIIEFLQTIDKKCLTKPNKVFIVKPFLTDIVSQMHLLYSDLRKFNSDKERHNYLNKVSDLLAMIIDLEITTAKIYLCKKCEGKSFRTEAILKNHLKKIHKIKTSTGDWWTDDNDSNSYIGIAEGQREKLVSMLTSSLYTYLDNSSNHIIDTMLKTTNKNKNKASKIFSRIFSRILRAPAAGLSIVEYARHVLAFKMWKKMLDSHQAQREVTRLAAARLPLPPPLFRERVAVLEGIMPYVPPSTPDHAVTVYCLSVLSVRGIKYELKDQLQKYLLLISNPHRYTELLKHSKVFSENRNDFDVKDSIFAVDEEDMIFYDTFPPESPTKNTTSNKKGAEKKSADKKSVDRKSAEKKSSDKKCKSSATVTVDCQRDSNLVAADPSELVTSSNEFQHTLSETKIKTEILDELDAEDKVCAEEETAVTCAEECEEVTEVAHDLTDRTSCDQKRTDIQIKRKLVEDKYSDQKYLNRVWPEKKTQIVTPFAASSGLCATNLKPPCDDPMPLDLQKSCDNAMQLDLHKSCDNAMLLDLHKSCDDGMPLDLHKSCDNALPLDLHKSCDNTMPLVLPNLCDPWSPDLFGEMEKCIDENALDDADDMAIDADDRLAMKIKQELSELKADAFERRKSTLQEDDFTEEFSEQSTGELSCDIINLLNSPDTAVFDLLTKNTPDSRWFSMIMDVDMEDVIGNDASNCFKGNMQFSRDVMSLEALLLDSPSEQTFSKEHIGFESPKSKALCRRQMDLLLGGFCEEEPQPKKARSSSDSQNYPLTPPATPLPLATENAKSQVESQQEASSSRKDTPEKNPENSPKPCCSEKVYEKNKTNGDRALPEQIKSSPANRPTSTSKNVNCKNTVVDRTKDNSSSGKPAITLPECTCDQRLSGSRIDACFTYFHRTKLICPNREKTYIFSVSFYPLLTSECSKAIKPRKNIAERRHSQVESITRNVDIFKKDFIIFPIEKHGHWLVVIVCFPGLTGPVEYQPKEQIEKHSSPKKNLVKDEVQPRTWVGKARRTRSGCYTVYKKRNSKEANDCDTDSNKTTIGNIKSPTKTSESILGLDDWTSNGSQPIKQPCILVFDSSPKPRRTEVVEVIRDYLKVEYKVKHGEDNDFSSMKFCKPEVPTRQDSACCGLYMLVYADSFFNNPIVDYRLPIKHLGDWFPLETVAKKREEIDRFVPDLSRAPSKPLDSLGAVAVLEDCNTSQDVTNDFCGFDLDQPLHGLLSADHRTDHFLNDDDDNAVMDVIERPVTPRPTPTPQLCVTLSRCSVEYVSPPLKKKRGRRRTAAPSTALKTLSTVKRKILGSEKPIATRKRMVNSSSATRKSTGNSTSLRKTPGSVNSTSPKKETAGLKNPTSPRKTAVLENSTSPRKTAVLENSTTSPRKTASPEKSIATRKTTAVPENSTAAAKKSSTSKKNEPANNPAKKGKKPAMKRRSLRRRKPPPKSVIILRSASNKAARGKDNSTLIPLRKPVVNEYWKNIQKQDKQNSRRCSK